LAKAGQIKVNGETVKDSGAKVDVDADVLEVRGERVYFRRYIYLMMNKPAGVISATEDLRERTVLDLLSAEHRAFEPFPVGRLDKDTEGLLLLTNDGQLAHRLLSPKKHVPKLYYAEIEGLVDERDVAVFRQGVELDDGYVTMPAKLTVLDTTATEAGARSRIEVQLHEGKFHQVKRMFAAVGKRVTYLKRIAMGGLPLDPELALGSYRELTKRELASLTEGTGDEHQTDRA
jgi:16S rRNA pseudouridine516 synthase